MLQRGGIHVSTGQRVLPEKIKNREYTNALKRGKAGLLCGVCRQPGLFMNAVAKRLRPKPAGASRK